MTRSVHLVLKMSVFIAKQLLKRTQGDEKFIMHNILKMMCNLLRAMSRKGDELCNEILD